MQNQNEIEKKIVEAFDSLSQEEPREGHEQRFDLRLKRVREESKFKTLPRWPFILLAAASVAALIITLVVSEIHKTNDLHEVASLSDVSYEMEKVEEFYTHKLEENVPIASKQDEVIIKFNQELFRLENEYKELERALAKNTSNQKVIDAMVANYRFRLQIAEMMQRYIEINNSSNPSNHDSTTINS